MKYNDQNNEANACSEEKELAIDELMKFKELQEKPKNETKTDNDNKIQDIKRNHINDDIVEDIKNKIAGVTNDFKVKYRQKKSTERRVDKIRKKMKLSYKRTLCDRKCVTKNNEVQKIECNIKYLYTYVDRVGIKRVHE